MTPLPKKKFTRSRSNKRRSVTSRLKLSALTKCPSCGKLRVSHKACPFCGFYKKTNTPLEVSK